MEPTYDLGLAEPRPMVATDDDVDDDVLTTRIFTPRAMTSSLTRTPSC